MDLSKLYEFSKSFGPPKTDLALARYYDYGDEPYDKMSINHKLPEDVTFEELCYHPGEWAFMDIDSVLFYSYSVFVHHDDSDGEGYWGASVDSFFYTLDREINILVKKESNQILFDSIKILWHEKPFFFDLVQCPKLQDILGIHVTFEDESKYFDEKYPLK